MLRTASDPSAVGESEEFPALPSPAYPRQQPLATPDPIAHQTISAGIEEVPSSPKNQCQSRSRESCKTQAATPATYAQMIGSPAPSSPPKQMDGAPRPGLTPGTSHLLPQP